MKMLHLFVLCLLFVISGCTAVDPDIPVGNNSYDKGEPPQASIRVKELFRREATLEVVMKSAGNRKLTRFSLCYSETNQQPDTTDQQQDVLAQYIPDTDTLLISLSDLDPATNYYCNMYLAKANNETYTNSVGFTTKVASSGYSWQQMSDLPSADQYYSGAFTVNNRVFVFSSYDEAALKEGGVMQEYLPTSDTWVRRSDLPFTNRVLFVSMVIADKAYVGFGDIGERQPDGSTSYYMQTDWWCYDPAIDRWTRKADIPTNTFVVMAAFGVDDKGYVLTSDESSSPTPMCVFQYDPQKDAWIRKRNFPNKKLLYTASFVIGSRPFVFTGISNKEVDNSEEFPFKHIAYMWEYEVATDTWFRRADFKGGGREWMVATALDGIGYAGFGSKPLADNYLTSVKDWWTYHPDIDKWKQENVYEGWMHFFPNFAFTVNGSVYVGGRYQGVWKYTPEKDK